jgi:HK97 family phage prohead protease
MALKIQPREQPGVAPFDIRNLTFAGAQPGVGATTIGPVTVSYQTPEGHFVFTSTGLSSGTQPVDKAIPSHSTATTDASWDGPANEARLKNGENQSYYRKAYAWQDPSGDGTKKGDFKFVHHQVSSSGEVGAANTKACQAIISNLNGARSKPNIPSADRQGVWNHAAKHLRDAGIEPAPLKSDAELAALIAGAAEDDEPCECSCESCVAGNCANCTNTECDDENCDCDQNEENFVELQAAVERLRAEKPMNAITPITVKSPYDFRAAVKGDGTLELFAYDDIGGSMWSDGVTANGMRRQIENAGPHTGIRLRINSFGGDLFEGLTIGNYLKSLDKPVECCIDGLAASAASVMAMCADTITMAGNAMMMIHNASTMEYGYASDLRKTADVLDQVSKAAAQTYVDRTGLSMAEVTQMMDDETWIDAATCVTKGFATRVIEPDPDTAARSAAATAQARPSGAAGAFKKPPARYAPAARFAARLTAAEQTLVPDGIRTFAAGSNPISYFKDYELSAKESMEIFGSSEPVTLAIRSAGPERRAQPVADGRKITLLLAPYGKQADLGGLIEEYEPGCFKEGLKNDPRVTFNHDEACILGRQSANTARFWEEADGVHAECEAPDTSWANDLLVSMRRGDVDQASSCFWILKQKRETRNGVPVRIIQKALMREGAVLAFAAYKGTSAQIEESSAPVPMAARYDLLIEMERARG